MLWDGVINGRFKTFNAGNYLVATKIGNIKMKKVNLKSNLISNKWVKTLVTSNINGSGHKTTGRRIFKEQLNLIINS